MSANNSFRERCDACTYPVVLEWLAESLNLDIATLDEDYLSLDADILILDVEDKKMSLCVFVDDDDTTCLDRKYLTSDSVTDACAGFCTSIADIYKMLEPKLQAIEDFDLVDVRFNGADSFFYFQLRNKPLDKRNFLTNELKHISDAVNDENKAECAQLYQLINKQLETITDDEINKTNEKINKFVVSYPRLCNRMKFMLEDAVDNDEFNEKLLTRLPKISDIEYSNETIDVKEKLANMFNKK